MPAASDLGRCHYGDRECLKRTINSYAILLKNGRRDLNLVPIDPLQVDEVNINQGSTSPVNINLRFRDLKCYGLSLAVIKDIMYAFIVRSLNFSGISLYFDYCWSHPFPQGLRTRSSNIEIWICCPHTAHFIGWYIQSSWEYPIASD